MEESHFPPLPDNPRHCPYNPPDVDDDVRRREAGAMPPLGCKQHVLTKTLVPQYACGIQLAIRSNRPRLALIGIALLSAGR